MLNSPRRRSLAVNASLTAALALTISGCGSGDPEYQAVCADKDTGVRVDDGRCDRNTGVGGAGLGLLAWYYFAGGARFPGVGQRVTGGSYNVPSGAPVTRGGLATKGGSVVKGGFGSSSGGGGVGG